MKKPIKPFNPIETKFLSQFNGCSLQDVVEVANKNNLSLDEVYLHADEVWENGYSNYIISLEYYVLKYSDEEFKNILSEYKKELKIYNKWIKENR